MAEDFGFKVSLPGFDANNAADADLYINSSWPLLKIDESLSQEVTLNPDSATITHNLGYPPFTLVWSKSNGFIGPCSLVNSQTATVNDTIFSGLKNDTVRVYICRNPLNQNFLAPNIQLAQVQGGTNHQDFGIKFAKPNKNTGSTDLRDFTIHSGTKSLQVHQVLYQALSPIQDSQLNGNLGLKYLTDLPYQPVFFAFYSSDNQNFSPVFATSQTPPTLDFNTIDGGIILNDQGGSGGYGVFFILLDPYQTTTNIEVTL